MSKKQLLDEIKNTWVKLSPSKLHGIGVFAIRPIPKGCRDMFSRDQGEWTKIPKGDIERMPAYAKRMIKNYCTYDEKYYYVEKSGFKKMDLVCYINHSDTPNIAPVNNGEYFEAVRNIKAGEEILIDYAQIAG
jgi:SET domain-containing protein